MKHLFRGFDLLPRLFQIAFAVFLLIPVWSTFVIGSPLAQIRVGDLARWIAILAYWIGPLALCAALLLRSYAIVSLFMGECAALLMHTALGAASGTTSPALAITRAALIACVAVLGFAFLSRDIVMPFFSAKRRGFRGASRLSVNSRLNVAAGSGPDVAAEMEDCSLLGMSLAMGAPEGAAPPLAKGDRVKIGVVLSKATVSLDAVVEWCVRDELFFRAGVSTTDVATMAVVIKEVTLRAVPSYKAGLMKLTTRTSLSRAAMVTWLGCFGGVAMIPACGATDFSGQGSKTAAKGSKKDVQQDADKGGADDGADKSDAGGSTAGAGKGSGKGGNSGKSTGGGGGKTGGGSPGGGTGKSSASGSGGNGSLANDSGNDGSGDAGNDGDGDTGNESSNSPTAGDDGEADGSGSGSGTIAIEDGSGEVDGEGILNDDGAVILIKPTFEGGNNFFTYWWVACDNTLNRSCGELERQRGVDGIDLERPELTPTLLPASARTWLAQNASKRAFLITGWSLSHIWGVGGYSVRLAATEVYDSNDVTYAETCPSDRVFMGARVGNNTADKAIQRCAKLKPAFMLGPQQALPRHLNFGINDECPNDMIMTGRNTPNPWREGGVPYTLNCAPIIRK